MKSAQALHYISNCMYVSVLYTLLIHTLYYNQDNWETELWTFLEGFSSNYISSLRSAERYGVVILAQQESSKNFYI